MAEMARAQGKDTVDTFLDTVVADNLCCEFTMASFNTRVDRMAELLNDPSILIGLGDGGAHVDMLCDCGYPTYLLGTWVRERGVLSIEQAVRRLTSDPADFSVSVTAVDYNLDWPQILLFLILIRSVPGTGGKDAMTCPVVENGW